MTAGGDALGAVGRFGNGAGVQPRLAAVAVCADKTHGKPADEPADHVRLYYRHFHRVDRGGAGQSSGKGQLAGTDRHDHLRAGSRRLQRTQRQVAEGPAGADRFTAGAAGSRAAVPAEPETGQTGPERAAGGMPIRRLFRPERAGNDPAGGQRQAVLSAGEPKPPGDAAGSFAGPGAGSPGGSCGDGRRAVPRPAEGRGAG